ncbi:DUF4864 domain-containing protein [Marivita sp. S2033]|uniref:DUF4864 domain-containing protein n=1 Tax=Marivita sp. S2033 TaxID=3373187 RepID=UPI0039825E44
MRKLITGATLAIALAGAVWAQEPLTPESGIKTTIQSQIDAFLRDDFAKAFSFAGPNIRSLFGTPENFGAMVRRGYPMVWRPDTVRFGLLRDINGDLHQTVIITDADGALHYLDYHMEQVDGDWRIVAVQVLQAPDVAA